MTYNSVKIKLDQKFLYYILVVRGLFKNSWRNSVMKSEFQFYRVNELTKILSVSRASIYNWLNKGTFPKPIKISDSVNVWRASDIQKWVKDKEGEDIIN